MALAPTYNVSLMVCVGGGVWAAALVVHEEQKRVSGGVGIQAWRIATGQGRGQDRQVLTSETRVSWLPVLRLSSSSSPNMDTTGREERGRGEGTGGDRGSEDDEEGEEGEEGEVSISAGPLE